MRVGEYISRHQFFFGILQPELLERVLSLFLVNIMKDNVKAKHNHVYFDLLAYKLKKKLRKTEKIRMTGGKIVIQKWGFLRHETKGKNESPE